MRRGRPRVLVSHMPTPGDDVAAYRTRPASLDAIESAIDAAIQASPPAFMATVRDRLAGLGVDDGAEERALVALLLELFVHAAPDRLAAFEAALAAGDDRALETGAARLGSAAAHLGADSLARLCADLEDRARSGSVPPAAAVRAALRRELTVTCRVLSALATELASAETGGRPIGSPD